MVERAFSILFVAPQDPAEAVAVSGLIPRLLHEIPEARFTVLAGAASAPLFAHVPSLVEVITIETYEGLVARLGLWNRLRERKWGLVVDMGGAWIAEWLHRRRRAERPRGPWKENRTLAAARLLGFDTDPPPPFLYTTPELEAAAEEALAGEGPILAVGPGARWIGRTWPGERYGQVATQLLLAPRARLSGGRIVAFGEPSDREAMMSAVFPVPRKRIIQRPYGQGLLADYAWLKRCRLYLGGDNVWTHLAAAAGVPTVALYGPSDEKVVAPFGDHVRVVRGPRDYETLRAADPEFSQQISHMVDLPVDWVLTAARGRLIKTRHAKP